MTQTLISSPAPAAFADAFTGRLAALTKVHALLTDSGWQGTMLADLVAAEVAPYRAKERDNVTISGEPAVPEPQAALAPNLALHELATNAAKYGALSVPDGRIDISWWREDAMLSIRWVESGGPRVQPPARYGFGSKLIERSLAYELEGASKMVFEESGLRCELRTRWRT